VPDPFDDIVDAVLDLLSEHRSLTETELIEALVAAGFDLGPEPGDVFTELLDDDLVPLYPVGRSRWALLPTLLDGQVLTHRLTQAELDDEVLTLGGDLVALTGLLDDERYLEMADGTVLDETVAPDGRRGALGFPFGDLADREWSAGDVVAVAVTSNGLAIDVVDPATLTVPDALHAAVADALDDAGGRPLLFEELFWHLAADDETLFGTARLPFTELIDALEGATSDQTEVATAGFDFVAHRAEQRITSVQRRHQLAHEEAEAVVAVTTLFDRTSRALMIARQALAASEGTPPTAEELVEAAAAEVPLADAPATDAAATPVGAQPRRVADALHLLADPDVIEALATELLGVDDADTAGDVVLFAEQLEQQAPVGARASLRWLRAKALDRGGAVLEAESELRAALAMDPDHAPALFDLARYASDRGDAERGIDYLRRAGVHGDDPLLVLLEAHRPPSRKDIGRNDPCWCGSGQKYKRCHQGREELPLEQRVGWLLAKTSAYLEDGPWRMQVLAAAVTRAEHWDDEGALWHAMGDPLVHDVVLMESGGLEGFLAERAPLLPDDERAVLEQWRLTERSQFEVVDVEPGLGLTVRDLRTGEVTAVTEHLASRQLAVGDLVCTRVSPVGEQHQLFGGVEPVALGQRDELMALLDGGAKPTELVAFLSQRFAPTRLVNTDGDPMVLIEVDLRASDPAALATALDATYDPVPPDGGDAPGLRRWHETAVTSAGMTSIRAALSLEGDALHVSVNSEQRWGRVLEVLDGLDGRLEVLDLQRTEMHDANAVAATRPGADRGAHGVVGGQSFLAPDDPAIAAVLAQVIERMETAWLDESIPALGGITPRQAAPDPTRRPDLEALLRSFDRHPKGPGAMDPDRLRAALGL
jgi:tetratricopeptide (TPR) repeat protein